MNINIDKVIAELNKLEIDEEEKKLFLDLLQNIQSPIKFDYDTLDDKLKPFFQRDKEYYLFLENYFKNSVSNLEMIKKFLNEFPLRVNSSDLNDLKNIRLLSLIFINKKIKKYSIIENEYKDIKEKFNTFDKLNHYYPMQYNTWLFQKFFFEFLMNSDNYFTIRSDNNTYYYLDKDRLIYLIENELFYLKSTKDFLKVINENMSIIKLTMVIKEILHEELKEMNNKKFDEAIILKLKRIELLQKYLTNEEPTFLNIFDFFKKVDKLENIDKKIALIEYLEDKLNIMKNLINSNLEIFLKNINEQLTDKKIKKAFIEFLINSNTYLQFINNSIDLDFNPKKFYFELDFSLPEELIIEQIKTLYREHKKGNIKTFEEFALNKQVKKYSYLKELQNNYIFKIKDEKKIPLYVKLVDLIYILDMWLINMKNVIVIKNIEENRSKYDSNSFKRFDSTYKKYKKFIIDFYINKKFENYL